MRRCLIFLKFIVAVAARLTDPKTLARFLVLVTTGVRRIIFQGARRVTQTVTKDIWEARFIVNWRGSVITA